MRVLSEAMADDCNTVGRLQIVVTEGAANYWFCAERDEESRRDRGRRQSLRVAIAEVHAANDIGPDGNEGASCAQLGCRHGIGQFDPGLTHMQRQPSEDSVDADESVGLGVRRRPKQYSIDDAEYGCIRADRDSQ